MGGDEESETKGEIQMNETIIYMATMDDAGRLDAQVRPVGATMEGYAIALSVMVRATVNMFVESGVPEKEALDTILKRLTREARNPSSAILFGQHNPH